VVAIADVYDALRSKRSYKDVYGVHESLKIMREGDDRISPQHFNPIMIDLLEKNIEEIEEVFYG
jgi:HD-GYP domain-containing protein (c-di-GMP phosphodiesterase class II)